MKKIFIRAGITAMENPNEFDVLREDYIGGNTGNLVYQYSVMRALMCEETEFYPTRYQINPDDADMINEQYDCFVIPLADAFRPTFIKKLNRLTKLVERLNIPCIVIGVGLRSTYEPKLEDGFPFDDNVKAFAKAVLDKSAMIGVRGQITSDYLTQLGFKEGKHHTVIGCPSMYMFGPQLKIRNTKIDQSSKVCFNTQPEGSEQIIQFMNKNTELFPQRYFIPQLRGEMMLRYFGLPASRKTDDGRMIPISDSIYLEDNTKQFINVPSWLSFMEEMDFCFGPRMHGTIIANIVGVPLIFIAGDARTRELSDYHNLCRIQLPDITGQESIMDFIEDADFKAPLSVQQKNFEHSYRFFGVEWLRSCLSSRTN